MQWRLEAWTIPSEEEPVKDEMVHSEESSHLGYIKNLAFEWMAEGYQTRVYPEG